MVRQRASYAETIARVMREESLPCNLEARVDCNDIPANRAALKLFAILEEISRDEAAAPRVSELADLIKSEYFRLNEKDLKALTSRFDSEYAGLLREKDQTPNAEQEERLKQRYRIGFWDADALENAFAYVGSQLRVSDWIARAGKANQRTSRGRSDQGTFEYRLRRTGARSGRGRPNRKCGDGES